MLRWKFLLLHSRFTHTALISLCVPFLIPWHRDMSVGRSPSLRMLECPLVQGSEEVRATVILTEEIHTIIGRVARCGVNTKADSRVKFFACITAPCCMAPLSPTSSSLCLLYSREPPWHRSQDASRHYSQNSSFTFVKNLCRIVRTVTSRVTVSATECLRTEERKIV